MAAINEGLTGTTASTVLTPSDTVSNVIVDGTFEGSVALQTARPSSSVWHTLMLVGPTEKQLATPVVTSDPAIQYRFLPNITSGTANVYMGP